MHIVVSNPAYNGPECRLDVGDELEFGRECGGVGRIGESPTISRRHGTITAVESGYAVEATGTFSGIVVTDRTTPSRLYIPHGVGPVEIPFHVSAVSVDGDDASAARLDVTVVGSTRADMWASQWGIDAPPNPRPVSRSNRSRTVSALATRRNPRRYRKSNGVYYAWFTVLVALCEPALGDEPGVAPTNQQLARRTGLKPSTIEKKLQSIYEALEVDTNERPRDVAIQHAISNGIVTRQHLSMLPDDGPSRRRVR
ncbi:MAG: hypothetical protein KDB37_04495 [Ilumatobacter sp.]|nr:hypothetical protein [Ilumatobacter sp.]